MEKETIQITAEASNEDLSKVSAEVNKAIADLDLPNGAKVNIAGATESMQENFTDLFKDYGDCNRDCIFNYGYYLWAGACSFCNLVLPCHYAVGGILGLIISGTPVDVNSLDRRINVNRDCRYKRYRINRRVQQNREHGMKRESLT